MGQLSFILPASLPAIARRCLDRACMAGGYDLTPVPTRLSFAGNRLTVSRDTRESGFLTTPWPADGVGCPVVSTATLRERPEPYHLLTELARGKVNHVRTLAAEWELAGMDLTAADRADLVAVVRRFAPVALEPQEPASAAAAGQVLADAHRLGDRLTRRFSEVLMDARVAEMGPPGTRFGARLTRRPEGDAEAAYRKTFNAARLVPDWAAVEPAEAQCDWTALDRLMDWATAAGLTVSVGPLVDLTTGPYPDWLRRWEGDLPSLAAFLCDFVETLLTRYRDREVSWQVLSGFNHADALGLDEDDRLRLADRLLTAARQAAPDADLGIGLALPWGDYLTSEDLTYSPLVFADTLIRGGHTLAGLELELLCGAGPRASLPRTVLDCYRLLDLFALLGVPLELALAAPPEPLPGADRSPVAPPPGWVEGVTFLGLSVSQVRAIHWDGWTTGPTDRVPDTTLWSPADGGGAYLTELARLRKNWLG